jgi:hypothetical protein
VGVTSKFHFSPRLSSEGPKIGALDVPKCWALILFSNQIHFENTKKYFIALENIFPMVYYMFQSNPI